MITLDALRTALLSDQPYTELDRLVRAELSAGRLTKPIRAELLGLEGGVRDVLEVSEDAEDALRDTIDALAGFCPAKYAYHNPPVLPTEEEVAELTRWARVAFAARCARRVLPLFQHFWPAARKEHAETVANDIEVAELSAASATRPARGGDSDAAAAALEAHMRGMPGAQAVARAAHRAVQAAEVDPLIDVDYDVRAAAEAAEAASVAATHVGGDIRPSVRRDFDQLARMAPWQKWTDDTPVPLTLFGPLWPEGSPPGWPADPDTPPRPDPQAPLRGVNLVLDAERPPHAPR